MIIHRAGNKPGAVLLAGSTRPRGSTSCERGREEGGRYGGGSGSAGSGSHRGSPNASRKGGAPGPSGSNGGTGSVTRFKAKENTCVGPTHPSWCRHDRPGPPLPSL